MFEASCSWLDQTHIRSRLSNIILLLSMSITLIAAAVTGSTSAERRQQAAKIETFRQIVANLDSAVVVVDQRGKIQEWNPAATKLFGWTPKEAIGADMTLLVPDSKRDEFRKAFDGIMAKGITTGPEYLECWGVSKTGSVQHVMLTLRVAMAGENIFAFALIDHYQDAAKESQLILPVRPDEPVTPPELKQYRSDMQ